MKRNVVKKVLASALLLGIGALCVAGTNRPVDQVFTLREASVLDLDMPSGQDRPCSQAKPEPAFPPSLEPCNQIHTNRSMPIVGEP